MNVYEISVRKLQRVQVKEYEPAEAEITIKAQLEPGDDYHVVMSKLIDDASIGVREGLGLSPSGKIIMERTPAPVAAKVAPASKPVPPAADDFGDDAPASKPVPLATDDFGDDAPAPVKRRGRPPKAKPVEDDFGDEPAPSKKAEAKPVEDDFDEVPEPVKPEPVPAKPKKRDDVEEDARQYIMELITGKKISAADVRLIVKEKFNVTTMRDVPDEYLGDLKEAIDLKIEADAV